MPSFPLIKSACAHLRNFGPGEGSTLMRIGWTVPANCLDERVAILGPFALRVVWFEWAWEECVEEWGWCWREGPGAGEMDQVFLDV